MTVSFCKAILNHQTNIDVFYNRFLSRLFWPLYCSNC